MASLFNFFSCQGICFKNDLEFSAAIMICGSAGFDISFKLVDKSALEYTVIHDDIYFFDTVDEPTSSICAIFDSVLLVSNGNSTTIAASLQISASNRSNASKR